MRAARQSGAANTMLPIAFQLPRWLWTLGFANAGVCAVVTGLLWLRGDALDDAVASVGSLHAATLLAPTEDDSWTPMLRAYQLKRHDPGADVYRLVLNEHVKFQYPPSALFAFDLIPARLLVPDAAGAANRSLITLLSWVCRLCVLANLICAVLALEIAGRRAGVFRLASDAERFARMLQWLRLGLASALAIGFYPLFKAYSLGQLQVFLNALIALGLLCYLLEREAGAGALLALCCLMKPQYGVVLLFGVLRRRWSFAAAFLAVFGAGTALAIARYGLHDYVRYLEVLKLLARLGETYWPNQSLNGLLHRLVDPAHASVWTADAFGSYNPWIQLVSSLNTALIVGLCAWPFAAGSAAPGGVIDLCVTLAAATLLSPVAWEHHYGYFVVLFAVALPWLAREQPLGAASVPLLGLSFLALSNALLRPELIYRSALRGLLGSHVWFGALGLFALLLALRVRPARLRGSP